MAFVSPTYNDRSAELVRKQVAKMARTPHAFVRGSTARHYEWMQDLQRDLPAGPPIWICGDCHLGNLGPIADADGHIDIQIRDLDQTVIGNPAHDLIRLALSLASAARGSNLPGVATARMIEEMVVGYESGLFALDHEEPAKEPTVVRTVRRQALNRRWHHLARERIKDVSPKIPLGQKFWSLSDEEKWAIGVLVDSPHVKSLILSFVRRDNSTKVELRDTAYWVKGCSSLGLLRCAALVHVGTKKNRLSLIDIKEAVPSVAPASSAHAMPDHAGERVVAGARALSPNLGDRMAAGDVLGKPVFVRELLPEDMKLDIEQFTREEAVAAARYLAAVVGKAHGRQMSPDDRAAWLRELKGRHPPDLAAPTWLWTIVVALLVKHEQAYLDHCRAALESASISAA